MTGETQEKGKKIELGEKVVGEIELPTIDIKPHIGKEVEIEKVEEFEGHYGYYIKVETKVVAEIERGKDKNGQSQAPIYLRGSRIFGLQEDKEGRIGWGAETKLGVYLKKMKVSHYKDLVGKKVILQSVTDKEGTDFLSFN